MDKNNKNKVLLIVDDDPNTRDIYSIELQAVGFEILTASNGEEGLKTAIASKPALILLDIQMPVMDGLTMLGKLREEGDYGKNVPVILLTNLSASNEEIIQKLAETGPSYYIVKVNATPRQVLEKVVEKLALDK